MKTNEKTAPKPVKVKQTGKVIGMVITDCPMCKNTISFDIQTAKFCPYCNAEVAVDLDRVEVVVRASRAINQKGPQKRVA
ncbi:MAG: hypothetical protein KFF77_11145 [Bacteroidetes bacterium]|nr:hypothetical protein [Bacteroidota bacterium]